MESLRINRDLREFVLQGVQQTEDDKLLGTGSYGTVEEVTISNTKYAAKRIHAALLETDERRGVERIVHNFVQECRLMSSIRHTNITQFMGICFLDGSRLPLLVMERLDNSLDDLLESCPSIPFPIRVTILTDVSRGLHFLHQQTSCIIHRDLTAKNVLLTVSLKAKITDFGNSRLVHLQPNQLARTLTGAPGTLVYMPPEALSDSHTVYGPSLDVFSFGVVMLFTLNQVFPGDLLSATHHDVSNPDLILGRSEFERRVRYTDLLKRNLLGGRQHPLFVLVRECLYNAPERRPRTSRLLYIFEQMMTEIDVELLQIDIGKVKVLRSLVAKDKKIAALQGEVVAKEQTVTEKDAQLEAYRNELVAKNIVIAQNNLQLAERATQLADKEAQIQEFREMIARKDAELARRVRLTPLLKDQSPSELKAPLTMKWRRGKDMPFTMINEIQSVVIGDKVCVGGGYSFTSRDMCTMMMYDLQGDQWSKLPLYSARLFAMAAINNQLVLVGGCVSDTDQPTHKVSVLESDKWVCPYPALNIARYSSTVVSFSNHIIVAGGRDSVVNLISSVEVLDISSNRWCIADRLPCARSSMRSVVQGNMCYLMGGVNQTNNRTKVMHCVDLIELTENVITMATGQTRSRNSLWHALEDTPLFYCSPLVLKGSLMAFGGCDDRYNPNTSIYVYQSGTRRWVKVGTLPTARYKCSCSVLPNGEAFVAGGLPTEGLIEFVTVTESP